MKKILEFVWNLLIYIFISTFNLLQLCWYGRLPKMSIYHQARNDSYFTGDSVFNDMLHQSRLYPAKNTAGAFLAYLSTSKGDIENVLTMNVPIYSRKHEKVGTQTVHSVILDLLREWQRTEENNTFDD